MRKFSKKQYLAAGVAAAIITAGAGAAYAYWTTSGSGTSSGTVGTDAGFTVAVTGPSGLVLDQAKDISVGVTNNATYKQQLNKIHITVTGTQDSNGKDISASCMPSWFSVVDPTVTSHEVAGSGVEPYTGTITLVDDPNASQDACMNATVLLRADAS